ncbi:GumC family protein [Maribacter litoralis]|uniref:GumC family protein n=1 Tax=Maribacter litoralis TaxID=2059726 RepID=UPI003F5CD448
MISKSNYSFQEDSNLKDVIKTYSKHWKWFIISTFFMLTCALIYLRYAIPEYASGAKLEIVEDKNSSSELSAFSDLQILTGGNSSVEDEMQILNSRSNFIDVVKELNLNVKLIALGTIKNSEVYTNKPIKINFISNDSIINEASFTFFIELTSANSFGYSLDIDSPSKIFSYGNKVSTEIGDIVLTPNLPYFKRYLGKKFKISINPVYSVAEIYQEKISIVPSSETSKVLSLSLQDPIQKKAIDIIDVLIKTYNKNAIADKKMVADKTADFINERIREISTDLTSTDQIAEDFKASKGITDIASEANLAMNVGASSRQELDNAKMQLNIASGVKEFVSGENGYEVLPTNIGLSDPTIANTTAKYNELVSERNRLLQSADEKNPIVVNLDQQLNSLKKSMTSSLEGIERNLGMQVNNLSGQLARMNSIKYSAPRNQRELTDITRQQQTTESLYLYLLQKREESQISAASSPEQSKIIDNAHAIGNKPVTPRKSITILAAFMLGILVPFGVIYVNDLMDDKIHNKVGLEKLLQNEVPVLGELPKLSKNESKIMINNDRSVLSEALRIIRTNLDFLINTKSENKNNIIYVTSSTPGEGKTFLSSNLSMVLASTNKRVLLIGADIRNPKLYNFFVHPEIDKLGRKGRSKDVGLTEFLYDDNVQLKDIVNSMLAYNNTIDVIYSGKIPLNPSELLMSSKFKLLLDEVSEQYDYVIVDTAPLLVVTDTLLISKYADHTLYVVRAGVTENRVIDYPVSLMKEGKVKGLSFIVNGVNDFNLGYGGKYGYGYGKSTSKWWKF